MTLRGGRVVYLEHVVLVMLPRIALAAIALVEVLLPKTVAQFVVGLLVKNPEDVELRGWVPTLIRMEGLLVLGYLLWRSRDEVAELRESAAVPSEFDSIEDIPTIETEPEVEEAAEPVLRADTTRFTIASALYHADDPLAVADIVDLAEGSDWEVGRSTASATLYRMYRDDLVDRRERDDGRGYVYWLADRGREALEQADEPIAPNPFQEAE